MLTTSGANPVTVPFTLSRTTVDDDTEITLSFGATGGELPDGQYMLTVDKDKVRVGPICERGAAMIADRVALIENASPNDLHTCVVGSNLDGHCDEHDLITVFIAEGYLAAPRTL